jgi:hypothetical protein
MREVKNDFGIEIEIEGTGGIAVECAGWQVHNDGSLRGPGGLGAGGIEYVTRSAVSLGDVTRSVDRLAKKLEASQAVIRPDSPRTSTHIHMNMQQEKMIDVLGCLVLFAAVEPLFLHLCGPYRDGNSFCTPSYDSGDLGRYIHDIGDYLHKGHNPDYRDFPQRGKYASMGTNRLHDLGTIECRTFPCSVDPATIGKWCGWLYNLRQVAKAQDDKSFRTAIKVGLHNPLALVMDIFGDIPESQNLAMELVQYGSQEAYEFTRILKHWLRKEAEPEKPAKKKGMKFATPEQAAAWDWAQRVNLRAPAFAQAPVPVPAFGITDLPGDEE